jgi:hypothetical protein
MCLVARFLLVAIPPWSKLWQEFLSDPLHWWDSSGTMENVSKCNMLCEKILLLMEKVSAAFSLFL